MDSHGSGFERGADAESPLQGGREAQNGFERLISARGTTVVRPIAEPGHHATRVFRGRAMCPWAARVSHSLVRVLVGVAMVLLGAACATLRGTVPPPAEVAPHTKAPTPSVTSITPITDRSSPSSTPLPPTPTKTRLPTSTAHPPEESAVLIRAIRPLYGDEITIAGTGIVYDLAGLVLTAAHVVDGAPIIEVRVPGYDGVVSARLEGVNPCQDLAMVRLLEGGPFAPAAFGSSASVDPGDEVRVVAFPADADSLEDLSVMRGIVNQVGAKGIAITGLTYSDLIGTDASVGPGNSGGPLVAWEGPDKGKVIGVVVLQGGGEGWGTGYAVPVEKRADTIYQLMQGQREHWLGTLLVPMELLALLLPDWEFAQEVSGLLVFGVYPDSPADQVGMLSGDVLMQVNGMEVTSMDDVCGVLASSPAGTPISIAVWRGGTVLEGELFDSSPLEPSGAR